MEGGRGLPLTKAVQISATEKLSFITGYDNSVCQTYSKRVHCNYRTRYINTEAI